MSLPTRERELKLQINDWLGEPVMSLPTRERELKQLDRAAQMVKGGRSPRGSAN